MIQLHDEHFTWQQDDLGSHEPARQAQKIKKKMNTYTEKQSIHEIKFRGQGPSVVNIITIILVLYR